MTTPLNQLNCKTFAAQRNTKFKTSPPNSAPIELELVEVKDADPSPQIELFTLHFRGPSGFRLPQQIHRLEHAVLGTFDIFLTTIGVDPEGGFLYESVFHRFRKPAG